MKKELEEKQQLEEEVKQLRSLREEIRKYVLFPPFLFC
jgi:hypothetical protein